MGARIVAKDVGAFLCQLKDDKGISVTVLGTIGILDVVVGHDSVKNLLIGGWTDLEII